MEVEEEVQQGVALIIVGHGALLVVVAVTTADHHPNAIGAALLITVPTMAISSKSNLLSFFPFLLSAKAQGQEQQLICECNAVTCLIGIVKKGS
jgi:predicted alpha/beta hydrolase family esterase